MPRIILLIVIIWVLYKVFKRMFSTVESPSKHNPIEDIVQCAHCGVYIPKRGSYLVNQQYFCCIEHSKETTPQSSSQ